MSFFILPPLSSGWATDGMCLVRTGHTQNGDYPYVCLNNPELVAEVIFIKRHHAIVRENNIQKWS